jgi:tRNA/rRNA methyltransferase
MLLPEELDRVAVILVRARNPNNIGAVARAMHDFGFARLRVINDYPVPIAEARSAVDASDVIAAALTCASLADAVADCTLVVGTTAVGERHLHHQLLPLDQAAPRLLAELRRGGNVALLFGSEKTGLSNDELSHCNWLLTIPMRNPAGVRHVSMNLGQAAAVCLYELVRSAEFATESVTNPASPAPGVPMPLAESNPRDTPANPATAGQLESITALLAEVMRATEYTRRHAHNADPAHIRRLVRRIGTDAIDAPVWIGILKQILWKLSLGEERTPSNLEP